MVKINAWAANGPGQKLVPYTYELSELREDEVEIKILHCGICHSDLSVMNSDWGMTSYPMVPGHEVIGKITALGKHAKGLKIGQIVGVGWNSGCCMHCKNCISGNHQYCSEAVATIIRHNGGFADIMRSEWQWAIPIPDGLDIAAAGPLMCGGVTVFTPFINNNIKATDRVGIIGVGGLGHMAIKFAKAWGCEVTAFTHDKSKFNDVKKLGADFVVSSVDKNAITSLAGKLDKIIVTGNVTLDWHAIISTLGVYGVLHFVGAVLEPIPVAAFDLIGGQRIITGSSTGSPALIADMLGFAARHKINPQVEHFPMAKVNEAIAHLKSGKARYRIVLDAK